MKRLLIGILVLGAFVGAWWACSLYRASHAGNDMPPAQTEQTGEQNPGNEEPEFCVQVITPARNPETGDIKEFPTPCDVPEGWEVIMPEGMDMELQVI